MKSQLLIVAYFWTSRTSLLVVANISNFAYFMRNWFYILPLRAELACVKSNRRKDSNMSWFISHTTVITQMSKRNIWGIQRESCHRMSCYTVWLLFQSNRSKTGWANGGVPSVCKKRQKHYQFSHDMDLLPSPLSRIPNSHNMGIFQSSSLSRIKYHILWGLLKY